MIGGPPANIGVVGLMPVSERSLNKEMATHSNILTWNPMDREAWQTTVHGVTKSQGQLGD